MDDNEEHLEMRPEGTEALLHAIMDELKQLNKHSMRTAANVSWMVFFFIVVPIIIVALSFLFKGTPL